MNKVIRSNPAYYIIASLFLFFFVLFVYLALFINNASGSIIFTLQAFVTLIIFIYCLYQAISLKIELINMEIRYRRYGKFFKISKTDFLISDIKKIEFAEGDARTTEGAPIKTFYINIFLKNGENIEINQNLFWKKDIHFLIKYIIDNNPQIERDDSINLIKDNDYKTLETNMLKKSMIYAAPYFIFMVIIIAGYFILKVFGIIK